jgi:hypothetical protein
MTSSTVRESVTASVSWQLGHKTSLITRAVYVQEIKSAERTARRRARRTRMEARYGSILEAADRSRAQQTPDRSTAEVPNLQGKRAKAQ